MSYFLKFPVKLGGPGEIVEMDEAAFVKRKYNRGRLVNTQWVFGAYQPSTKEGFLFMVENCQRETLFPIIFENVVVGSNIFTDSAPVYRNLCDYGYNHFTVNHSNGEFVNQRTGATTNHIEAYWSRAKRLNKIRNGKHRSALESHLFEFMYFDKFKYDFMTFISHINQEYRF